MTDTARPRPIEARDTSPQAREIEEFSRAVSNTLTRNLMNFYQLTTVGGDALLTFRTPTEKKPWAHPTPIGDYGVYIDDTYGDGGYLRSGGRYVSMRFKVKDRLGAGNAPDGTILLAFLTIPY